MSSVTLLYQLFGFELHELVGTLNASDQTRPPVGCKNGSSTTHSKRAVRDEHGAIITEVPIESDVLPTDNQSIGAGKDLEEILRKINGDEASTATHTSESEIVASQQCYP